MPSLPELTERIRAVAADHPELRGPVTLDLAGTGLIRLADGVVDHQDGPADCRISLSADDLEALMEGRLDPTMAYMTGQLRVEGEMGLALKLASALRR